MRSVTCPAPWSHNRTKRRLVAAWARYGNPLKDWKRSMKMASAWFISKNEITGHGVSIHCSKFGRLPELRKISNFLWPCVSKYQASQMKRIKHNKSGLMGHSRDISWGFKRSLPTSHPFGEACRCRATKEIVHSQMRKMLPAMLGAVTTGKKRMQCSILQNFFDEGLLIWWELAQQGIWCGAKTSKYDAIIPRGYLQLSGYLMQNFALFEKMEFGKRKSKSKQQMFTISSTLQSSWLYRLHEWSIQLEAAKRKSGDVNCSVQLVLFSSWHETPTHNNQDKRRVKVWPKCAVSRHFWTKIMVKYKDGNKPWVFGGVH